MTKNQLATVIAFISWCAVLSAQRPAIAPGGVVNAASFAGVNEPGHAVAPGSIVAIFGTDLAELTDEARSFPLPTTLGGSSVTIDGTPAFLFFASPLQINALVPSGVLGGRAGGGETTVVVSTSAGSSEPERVELVPQSVGIFTLDATGCNEGAVQNVGPDGAVSVNGVSNAVSPGGAISIFATGLGAVSSPQPDGEPAPLDRLLPTLLGIPQIFLGDPEFLNTVGAHMAPALFAGRAPGLAGVDQVNAVIPEDAPEGCSVPLRLVSTLSSQNVAVSIRRGGGACSDPPPASAGVLRWWNTTASGLDPAPVADGLTIDFSSGINKRLPAARDISPEDCGGPLPPEIVGPTCPVAGERNLDAGTVTVTGPSFELEATRTAQGSYEVGLPSGAVQPGAFRVTAAGGDDVGNLTADLRIPDSIQLTSEDYPPGTVLPSDERLTFTWSGGDSNSVVRARLISRSESLGDIMWECAVLASEGQLVLPRRGFGTDFRTTEDAEIIVIHEPLQPETFAAPGLSLGGHHDWRYEFRFGDLRIR